MELRYHHHRRKCLIHYVRLRIRIGGIDNGNNQLILSATKGARFTEGVI